MSPCLRTCMGLFKATLFWYLRAPQTEGALLMNIQSSIEEMFTTHYYVHYCKYQGNESGLTWINYGLAWKWINPTSKMS